MSEASARWTAAAASAARAGWSLESFGRGRNKSYRLVRPAGAHGPEVAVGWSRKDRRVDVRVGGAQLHEAGVAVAAGAHGPHRELPAFVADVVAGFDPRAAVAAAWTCARAQRIRCEQQLKRDRERENALEELRERCWPAAPEAAP